MDAAPRPPLLKRVPVGGWMTISWCAVIAYAFSGYVLTPPRGWVLTPPPGGPLWHRVLLGLHMTVSSLSWAGLAMCGVVVLSAVLVRRWPLPALGLLLAAAIAAASAPQPAESIASFLIAPAGVAVGFIAATAPRRVSAAAAVVAFGVLARYGTNWRGDGLTADCWPAAIIIAWLIGQSIRQHRLHAATLRTQAQAAAVTAERLQITGELHDMVAHAIGVIAIQAGAGSRVIGTQPAQARNALAAIEATSRQTLAGVRRTLGALRRAEPGHEAGQAPPGPARMDATPRPPLPRRVLPGAWMVASWCAVVVYAISAQVLGPGGFTTTFATTTTPRRLVPTHMAGLRMVLDGFGAMPWLLLTAAGVVVLSALLLGRWPLPALALLLAAAIAAAMMPEPLLIDKFPTLLVLWAPAFFLIPPAGVAVGCIAATRPRPVSVGAAVITLGVLARYAYPGGGTPRGFPNYTSAVQAAAVATVIAWLIGQSIRQNRLHAETRPHPGPGRRRSPPNGCGSPVSCTTWSRTASASSRSRPGRAAGSSTPSPPRPATH